MRFTIPQFIEHEAKIIGPLNFKQVIFIGTAGVVCLILYFLVPFSVFLVACVILVGGGIALAFLKIGGRSLPLTLVNLSKFSVMPKIYIWKKREQPGINIYKKKTEFRAALSVGNGEGSPLKIGGKSQLKKLHTEIEIKTK